MRAIRLVIILTALLAACRTPPPAPSPTETASVGQVTAEPIAQTAVPTPWPTWPTYVWSAGGSGDGPTEIAEVPPSPTPTPTILPPPPTPATPPLVSPTPMPPCAPVQPPRWEIYIVKPGDTLGSLAQCAGSSIAALMAANCLVDPSVIWAGTQLFVPQLCVPGTTPTPTPPILPKEGDLPSGTTEGPSGGPGQVFVRYWQMGQQRGIFITFANIIANSLLNVTIQPGLTGQATTRPVCVNADGIVTTGYEIPEGFHGSIYINAVIVRDEALRLTICPGAGPLGRTGGDKGQITVPLPTPTPTASPTATEPSTPTASFGPTPTVQPTLTVDPMPTDEPVLTVESTLTVETEAYP